MTRDNEILIAWCAPAGGRLRLARLNVDDFGDPSEAELSGAEIHLTIMDIAGGREEPAACFRMSFVSAAALIRDLQSAIDRREPAEDGRP
jgi:hypothetical protein